MQVQNLNSMKALKTNNFATDWEDIAPKPTRPKTLSGPRFSSISSWIKKFDCPSSAPAKLVWGATGDRISVEITKMHTPTHKIKLTEQPSYDILRAIAYQSSIPWEWLWNLCSLPFLSLEDSLIGLVEVRTGLANQAFKFLWEAHMLLQEQHITEAAKVLDCFTRWVENNNTVEDSKLLKELDIRRTPRTSEDIAAVLCFILTWGYQNTLETQVLLQIQDADLCAPGLKHLYDVVKMATQWKKIAGCPLAFLIHVQNPAVFKAIHPEFAAFLDAM